MLLRPLDFGKSIFNWSGDRNQSDATSTLWVRRAQVGKPTIVRLRSGEAELWIQVARKAKSGAERDRSAAFDCVGVGIDNFTSDTIAVEGLITLDGVPATSKFLVVFFEPLLGVLVVTNSKTG
ncbi:unannotated protein [freshwater metagenome]|uniref:Unannotated protein n=1 Tax=freshwater metagenome TaxID=449393 RepID=A0A6J6DBV7_9ZZZZ